MAPTKPSLAWLSTALRGLIWLALLTAVILLFFWKPIILFCIGVLLALILIASFVIGGLFWNGEGKPTQSPPP